MSPNVPAQPAPILSGGVASMVGAQGAVAGTAAPVMFQGSAGAGAGAGTELEKRQTLYPLDRLAVTNLKRENEDLPLHREQGRRVVEEMSKSRYRNEPWVQEMIRHYKEDGGRPPRSYDRGSFKSWQEVYDAYELLGTGTDRDPLRGTSPKPQRGSRK